MATQPALEILSNTPEYDGYLKVSKLSWKLEKTLAGELGVDPEKTFPYTLLRAKNGVSVIPYSPTTDEVIITHEVRPTTVCISEEYHALLGPDAKRPSGILFGVILGAARRDRDNNLETLDQAMNRETRDEGAIVVSGRTKEIGTGLIQGSLGPEFVRTYAVEFDGEQTRQNMSKIIVDGRTVIGSRSGDGSKGEVVVTEIMKVSELVEQMKRRNTPETSMDMTGKGTVLSFLLHYTDLRAEWGPQSASAAQPDIAGAKSTGSQTLAKAVPQAAPGFIRKLGIES